MPYSELRFPHEYKPRKTFLTPFWNWMADKLIAFVDWSSRKINHYHNV